jgi:hypothetical protein
MVYLNPESGEYRTQVAVSFVAYEVRTNVRGYSAL